MSSPKRHSPFQRLEDLTRSTSHPIGHLGLVHEKLVPHNDRTSRDAKGRKDHVDDKSRTLEALVDGTKVPSCYPAAFRRWVRRTLSSDGPLCRRVAVATSNGRVLCGLGALTPTENGLAIHPTYGVPYLPGSSLKGITRAWLDHTVTEGPWAPGQAVHREVFGAATDNDPDAGLSGAVHFYDALWIPDDPNTPPTPWALEIATPHFARYYQQQGAPDGTHPPTPIHFLAAQGSFRLVVEGPPELVGPTFDLLCAALQHRGVGAKARAGYGRFSVTKQGTKEDRFEAKAAKEARAERERKRTWRAATDPVKVLEAIGKLEPHLPLRPLIVAWLLGKEHAHERLKVHPVTREAVTAVAAWAQQARVAKGLLKQIRGKLEPELFQAMAAQLAPSSPATEAAGGFGPNQLDHFDEPSGGKKKRAKWPNDFAQRICRGHYDEPTVRAAIDHLRKHGGKEGHIQTITRHYYGRDEP